MASDNLTIKNKGTSYIGVKATNPANVVPAKVDPPATDKNPVGTMWINEVTATSYQKTSNTVGYVPLGGGASQVIALDGDTGTAVPDGTGTIKIEGFVNETLTAAAGSTVTISFVPTPVFARGNVAIRRDDAGTPVSLEINNLDDTDPGSHAQLTLVAGGASGGNAFAYFTDGSMYNWSVGVDNANANNNLTISGSTNVGTNDFVIFNNTDNEIQIFNEIVFDTEGIGLSFTEGGGNARSGEATLVAGTITVNTLAVGANSHVILTRQDESTSTAVGTLSRGAIVAGTSFVINSLDATAAVETNDVSVVYWQIVNPAS